MIERQHLMRPLAEPATSATSYADLFSSPSDLLCREESSEMFSGTADSSEMFSGACPSGGSSIAWTEAGAEDSIIELIEGEADFVPSDDYTCRFFACSRNASARDDSIAWMRQVQQYYGFQPLTTYLSVNYMDRFLCSSTLRQLEGWPVQLLSVACLSLAAKMEEPFVPSLPDFQIIRAEYIFEPKTISRMELLVLGVLGWRLRSVTPFNFLDFFASKLDPTGRFLMFLISRATEIILANITEPRFLEHRPSSIAAAAILCASTEIPELGGFTPEQAVSWSDGLCKENISNCYWVLQDLIAVNSPFKSSKLYPPLRVTMSSDSSSSSSLSTHKRRKLNDFPWTDEKGNSDYDTSGL